MDTVLIIGIESVAGANIAATLQGTSRVVGISAAADVQIDGCRIVQGRSSVAQHLNAISPDRIIFCGASARSSWDFSGSGSSFDDSLAVDWATAANSAGIEFTMISTDAIFTGPWMSHSEDDSHHCDTPQAERLRQIESEVLSAHDGALIVRCNVFGWAPCDATAGFAETILTDLETSGRTEFNFLCHAAPILATDMADLLNDAHAADLSGVLHLGAAERTNPFQFAERLAEQAGLEPPSFPPGTTLENPVSGFGRGETTLCCSHASETLDARMPLIGDGVDRFLDQADSGFRAMLRSDVAELSRVA